MLYVLKRITSHAVFVRLLKDCFVQVYTLKVILSNNGSQFYQYCLIKDKNQFNNCLTMICVKIETTATTPN